MKTRLRLSDVLQLYFYEKKIYKKFIEVERFIVVHLVRVRMSVFNVSFLIHVQHAKSFFIVFNVYALMIMFSSNSFIFQLVEPKVLCDVRTMRTILFNS